MTDLVLTDRDFEKFQQYIHRLCGLFIQEEKRYLIQQRLEDLVLECGCKDFAEFYERINEHATQDLHDRIIAAITTNETSFFRDEHPFATFFDHVLPNLERRIRDLKGRQESPPLPGPYVRIWSAGSSTGQEAYSLAILIHEYVRLHAFTGIDKSDFAILATDVSSQVLARAMSGLYNTVEIGRGMSDARRDKYFKEEGNSWRIVDEIRNMVHFKRLNLVQPFTLFTNFDVILCRNVLIYFDDKTKKSIVERFYEKLNPGGFLILGSAESLYNLSSDYESSMVGGTIVYRKVE